MAKADHRLTPCFALKGVYPGIGFTGINIPFFPWFVGEPKDGCIEYSSVLLPN